VPVWRWTSQQPWAEGTLHPPAIYLEGSQQASKHASASNGPSKQSNTATLVVLLSTPAATASSSSSVMPIQSPTQT